MPVGFQLSRTRASREGKKAPTSCGSPSGASRGLPSSSTSPPAPSGCDEDLALIDAARQRAFDMLAAIRGRWTKRELERQIRRGEALRAASTRRQASAALKQIHPTAAAEFKNDYSRELLGLPEGYSDAGLHGAPLAVAIGGEDRMTLFICSSGEHGKTQRGALPTGRVDGIPWRCRGRVDLEGIACPRARGRTSFRTQR